MPEEPWDRLVFTQILAGLVILEDAPGLALDSTQAQRVNALLPRIQKALDATRGGARSEEAPRLEFELKRILSTEQKQHIAARVPATTVVPALWDNVSGLVQARMAGKSFQRLTQPAGGKGKPAAARPAATR